MSRRSLRLLFGGASLLLLLSLILIADTTGFLRATVGDYLVVLLLYALVRTVQPTGLRILPLLLFLFALTVEGLQFVDIVGLLGIRNENVQIAVGTVFDWGDIVAYALAAVTAAGVDRLLRNHGKAD